MLWTHWYSTCPNQLWYALDGAHNDLIILPPSMKQAGNSPGPPNQVVKVAVDPLEDLLVREDWRLLRGPHLPTLPPQTLSTQHLEGPYFPPSCNSTSTKTASC